MARRWFYTGDLNIERGGTYYCLDTWRWGYVDAIRVTPCSDAGAADNCYWVERLTVNIRTKPDQLANVLSTCGYSADDLPKNAARRHMLVDCHLACGAYDQESECVQMGVRQSEFGEPISPDRVLRGNTSLRRYVRSLCSA